MTDPPLVLYPTGAKVSLYLFTALIGQLQLRAHTLYYGNDFSYRRVTDI